MVLLGIVRRERLLELETRARGYPTESPFLKDVTMKKNLSNTEKPVKPVWAKYIATLEKHVAKKKLRYSHKVELKNFEFDEVFS